MVATSPQACDTLAEPGQQARLLSELRPGCRAVITSVSTQARTTTGQARLARRLHDLGLRPGQPIQMLRRAPLGDPAVFLVADYELCLRRQDAAHVQVTTVSTVTAAATAGDAGEGTPEEGAEDTGDEA